MGNNDLEKTSEEDEARSIEISMENIHQIDRCHLFECRLNKSSGQWYLAVATPESISLLHYNKLTNKYTLLKCIQTQTEAPCICMKFSNHPMINQLIYACGRDFFRLDIVSPMHPVGSIPLEPQLNCPSNAPIAVCVITSPSSVTYQPREGILLCYSTYGIFFVYNFASQNWQLSNSPSTKKSSSSSINNATNHSDSKDLMSSVIKWPRGNNLTPLQIEYDSSYLYLFYNDCIVVYQVGFENELSLSVRKCGITFIYKPRFLSTFSNKTSNCVIISNKRMMNEQQLLQAELERDMITVTNFKEENGGENGEVSGLLYPILQDFNDKICLSYFSPASK